LALAAVLGAGTLVLDGCDFLLSGGSGDGSGDDAGLDGGTGGSDAGFDTGPDERPDEVVIIDFDELDYIDMTPFIVDPTVDHEGGRIVVDDPSDALGAIAIDIPHEALPPGEEVTISVEIAPPVEVRGLPAGTAPQSSFIRISATGSEEWNSYRMFDTPVRVTLPYSIPATETAVAFYAILPDGSLEAMGQSINDTTNHTLTFLTRTFADTAEYFGEQQKAGVFDPWGASLQQHTYIAIGLEITKITEWLGASYTIDTGFRPSVNGWYIPNYGSYYQKSRNGNCWGMAAFAAHYYAAGHSPRLRAQYHDPDNTTTWLDDNVAIELASRVHNGLSALWNDARALEVDPLGTKALEVSHSLLGALYVTGKPQVMYIKQVTVNAVTGASVGAGFHAISTYAADIAGGTITFRLHDPNKVNPATSDAVTFSYTPGVGFSTYNSGTTAAESKYNYNFFSHLGFYVGMSHASLEALKASADGGFADGSVFPTFSITAINGKSDYLDLLTGETVVTPDGFEAYVTNDTAVVITGSIVGGVAQTEANRVNNVNIMTSTGTIKAAVDDSGNFTATVPLESGFNMIAMVASRADKPFSHWAGFEMIFIESRAQPSEFTVTMFWEQPASDVDLYVREPEGSAGQVGDTVYYSHRRGASATNPYLDFDNTSGYGPEHYIARSGMSSLFTDGTANPDGIYGDYTIRVHYYADHDDNDEEVQPISWNLSWRYLAYCVAPCADPESDGLWVEDAASGGLGTANSGAAGNIDSGDGSWSESYTVNYARPNPNDWETPPSHNVMLP
jgi:uncharacterized protein YfaP (DUF2135 family)